MCVAFAYHFWCHHISKIKIKVSLDGSLVCFLCSCGHFVVSWTCVRAVSNRTCKLDGLCSDLHTKILGKSVMMCHGSRVLIRLMGKSPSQWSFLDLRVNTSSLRIKSMRDSQWIWACWIAILLGFKKAHLLND